MRELANSRSGAPAGKGGRNRIRRTNSASPLGPGADTAGARRVNKRPRRDGKILLHFPIPLAWEKKALSDRANGVHEGSPPPARSTMSVSRPHMAGTFEPAAPGSPIAALLQWFYARVGLPLPRLDQLKGPDVPQPYKSLLVHSSDMTPTLENFYRQPLRLTVLRNDLQGDRYFREVLLKLAGDSRLVAYGVIRIHLDRLPALARRQVLEEQRPLGHILERAAVPHLSWPQAFFRVESDAHMRAMLRLRAACQLYGRRNVLLNDSRRLLAEVVEILAPVPQSLSAA
jgi:chorismate-pyruvate lyase